MSVDLMSAMQDKDYYCDKVKGFVISRDRN